MSNRFDCVTQEERVVIVDTLLKYHEERDWTTNPNMWLRRKNLRADLAQRIQSGELL